MLILALGACFREHCVPVLTLPFNFAALVFLIGQIRMEAMAESSLQASMLVTNPAGTNPDFDSTYKFIISIKMCFNSKRKH